uniref:ZP domain-containing protein n=1 Tax=Parascaris univalens TaxID=6257 RepID=A0A915CAT7_PARUN
KRAVCIRNDDHHIPSDVHNKNRQILQCKMLLYGNGKDGCHTAGCQPGQKTGEENICADWRRKT